MRRKRREMEEKGDGLTGRSEVWRVSRRLAGLQTWRWVLGSRPESIEGEAINLLKTRKCLGSLAVLSWPSCRCRNRVHHTVGSSSEYDGIRSFVFVCVEVERGGVGGWVGGETPGFAGGKVRFEAAEAEVEKEHTGPHTNTSWRWADDDTGRATAIVGIPDTPSSSPSKQGRGRAEGGGDTRPLAQRSGGELEEGVPCCGILGDVFLAGAAATGDVDVFDGADDSPVAFGVVRSRGAVLEWSLVRGVRRLARASR